MEKDRSTSLRDEIRYLREEMEDSPRKKKKKVRKFNIPLIARVSKAYLKRGYVIVQVINQNKSIDFRREPIIDGTIKLDDTIHAVDDFDVFFYRGKPFVIQPKKRINPYNPLRGDQQTYGQKYVTSRLESDAISEKKKSRISGMFIFILIIAAIAAYYFFVQ